MRPTKSVRTDLDMINSGRWNKAGSKCYRFEDGTVVLYNHNHWVWVIEGTRLAYRDLWAIRHEVETGNWRRTWETMQARATTA